MNKYQYDEIAEQYSRMFNITKQYVLIPTFIKIIGEVMGKSVLDLACGDGIFTRIIADRKPSEILGVDISKELLKKAIKIENKNPLNISYKIEDVLTLKLSRTFELITAVYLLNYAQTTDELEVMCKIYMNI